jgi:hypothetical protein
MKRLIATLIFTLICGLGWAQPGDPPPDPGEPVPITGIEILIGAGAALGFRKFYQKKKSE